MSKRRSRVSGPLALAELATMSIMVGLTSTQAASAASPTCAQRGNYYDGYLTAGRPQPTAVEAVRGAISNPGGYGLCGSDGSVNNFTTSWVMIVDRDAHRYGQAGYMYRANFPTGCVRLWAEDNFGFGSADYYTGGCVPLNAIHTFWSQMVRVNYSTYHLRLNEAYSELAVRDIAWPLSWDDAART